jgi:serine protease DegQ
VVVTGIDAGTPAAEAGLETGDVIVEINRKRVENVKDLEEVLEDDDGEVAVLAVYRDGHYFYLELEK